MNICLFLLYFCSGRSFRMSSRTSSRKSSSRGDQCARRASALGPDAYGRGELAPCASVAPRPELSSCSCGSSFWSSFQSSSTNKKMR